jgi:hypothetical protein
MKPLIKLFKSYPMLVILPFSFWIAANLPSCSKEPRFKDFLIKVDSVNADIATIYSETFIGSLVEINIYGIISYNGCSSFSHCNSYVKDNDLIIEAWKTVDTEAPTCPAVMVYLDQHITFDRDKLPESFDIKVKQPDGSFLVKKMK